jgi:PilZ domain-containing protein
VTAPSILVIDDGELDRVQVLLEHLPFDWVRCAEPDGGVPIETPLDLIISSGPRAMKMPTLMGAAHPLWVCIYDPDFLVLRERLSSLGVHYLVSSDLAVPTLERFLRQLLHRGQERRSVRRIPLDCAALLAIGRERRPASLFELSNKSCVVRVRGALAPQQPVSLCLDAELTGESSELVLPGSVVRAAGSADAGEPSTTAVVDFAPADGRALARLHDLLSGHSLGVPVTPLCAEPKSIAPEPDAQSWGLGKEYFFPALPPEEHKERRTAMRQSHGRRVEAIRWHGTSEPWVVLAKDLSSTGLCITSLATPEIGSEISLALYGRSREEPLLVGGRVVRVERDEVGVRFVGLTSGQRRGIDRLLAMSPYVEDLGAAGSARHVVELRRP